ncbi:MAG: hypothetical protein FWD76_04445 [Firmicutes bacterium]|nr:hypothetical protein [Bacillota bacterium]
MIASIAETKDSPVYIASFAKNQVVFEGVVIGVESERVKQKWQGLQTRR